MPKSNPFPNLELYPKSFQREMHQYDNMTNAEIETQALRHLNELRAQVGGAPFDHLPTQAELDVMWTKTHPKRTKLQELSYRLHRAWLALVSPDEL